MPLCEETVGGFSPSDCYSHGKGGNYGKGQADCSRVFHRQAKSRRCLYSSILVKYCRIDGEQKENLGEAHADIESGFYIPAYITEDGYLICFELEDNVVCEMIKRDLLTNVIVERLSQ